VMIECEHNTIGVEFTVNCDFGKCSAICTHFRPRLFTVFVL
jgi:hypothetical protein